MEELCQQTQLLEVAKMRPINSGSDRGLARIRLKVYTSGTLEFSDDEAASVVTNREAAAKGATARVRTGSAALGTRRALDSIARRVVLGDASRAKGCVD